MSLDNYYNQKEVYRKVSRGRLSGVLALIGDLTSKKILDIGCGAGEMGAELKQRGAEKVHGLDISSSAVEAAAKVLDGAAIFDFEQGEWPDLVRGQTYDFIVMSEVLEHLFKPEEALFKIENQFMADLIITVPNVLFWKNRLKMLIGQFDYTDTGLMDRGHIHFFSWSSLKKMVNNSGYRILATAHHVPTRGTKWLARFWPGLFSYQFIIRLQPRL